MLDWWQHLPETIQPIAFTVGFISIRWYAIFFLLGWGAAYVSLSYHQKKGFPSDTRRPEFLSDLFLWIFFGALVGARLGYVFFYNFPFFVAHPLSIVSPYDFSLQAWTGIAGMSYHGGIIGVVLVLYRFSKRHSLSFWNIADSVALVAPIAIFFGRLGNFSNLELSGRITVAPWGMFFPGVPPLDTLRHPSTLYEAILEGLFLFLLLFLYQKKSPAPGQLSAAFLLLYSIARFIGEWFRTPDPQRGFFFGWITLGQIFSLILGLLSLYLLTWFRKNRYAILQEHKS